MKRFLNVSRKNQQFNTLGSMNHIRLLEGYRKKFMVRVVPLRKMKNFPGKTFPREMMIICRERGSRWGMKAPDCWVAIQDRERNMLSSWFDIAGKQGDFCGRYIYIYIYDPGKPS